VDDGRGEPSLPSDQGQRYSLNEGDFKNRKKRALLFTTARLVPKRKVNPDTSGLKMKNKVCKNSKFYYNRAGLI
jgi:hypothetical protein